VKTLSARYVVEVVLAVAALIGAVLVWLSARVTVEVAPVVPGEPTTQSVIYHAPPLVLALLLATAAGVLLVLGVTGLRRRGA
jgi:zinc transporter ZupT